MLRFELYNFIQRVYMMTLYIVKFLTLFTSTFHVSHTNIVSEALHLIS